MTIHKKIGLWGLLVMVSLTQAQTPTESQFLVNPDFNLPLVNERPPGWFKARMPSQKDNVDMHPAQDDQGALLVMHQKEFAENMFSNWAQRIEFPPVGQTLRLETTLATENAEGGGAVVMLLFFDDENKLIGSTASKEGTLKGTMGWTPVTLKATVPLDAHLGMVRLGLLEGPGTVKFRHAHLYVSGDKDETTLSLAPEEPGIELLVNGDFEGDSMLGIPLGWAKAMLPDKAINMTAGIENDPNRGRMVFIKQEGVKSPLVNNWAQRVETVPRGARLRLTADVKTANLPANTGFVMLQCWGPDDKLLAAASSQRQQLLGGTQDWQRVTMEIDVPPETQILIVRCGLSQSGQIWFDNVSLMVISGGPDAIKDQTAPKAPTSRAGAFRVTDESVAQLKQIQTVAVELAAQCAQRLGSATHVRHEVFAQADGEYEVVIHVKMNLDDD